MAFPKKHTREIIVNDQTYLWHLRKNDLYWGWHHITIRHKQVAGQILFIDPYSWHFEVRPRSIREGILFALENNWNPQEKGKPLYISYQETNFFVLPEGIQFAGQLKTDDA